MKVLKSHTNFSSVHGIVALGIVACILFYDVCDPGHLGISSKEYRKSFFVRKKINVVIHAPGKFLLKWTNNDQTL